MPVQYCERCEKLIDLDEDVEHFDQHEVDDLGWRGGGNMLPPEVENPQPVKRGLKWNS